jgi:hypothetical protein
VSRFSSCWRHNVKDASTPEEKSLKYNLTIKHKTAVWQLGWELKPRLMVNAEFCHLMQLVSTVKGDFYFH